MHAHIVFKYSALWLGKNWHYPFQDIFIVLNRCCVLDVPRTQRMWGCGTQPFVWAFTTCIHEDPERETCNPVGYISRVMPWIWITVRKTWLFTQVVEVSKPYQLRWFFISKAGEFGFFYDYSESTNKTAYAEIYLTEVDSSPRYKFFCL